LSTGNELVDIDESLKPGKIVNSNSYSLAALVSEARAQPIMLGIVRDTEKEIRQAFQSARHMDFILSTGGVSVGDYDYVKRVIMDLGADIKFWKVRMKPGKPLVYGLLNRTPLFGLPGNPVSCMVSFHLFVRPALLKAMGYKELKLPVIKARLKDDIKAGGDRRHYLRARVTFQNGDFIACPMAAQGSGMQSSMVGANGLVIVETGITSVPKDSMVDVLLMRPSF
jgi:molybdopterin molybdotransferase